MSHRDEPIERIDPQRAEQLRDAIQRNPQRMTLLLAREFDVPEVEVIRALPRERVVELTIDRWEEIVRALESFGPVRVLVSNAATTSEVMGEFGGFSTTGDFFNVQNDSLDLHIRWPQLAAVFAVEKPGHMDGQATSSVQFFDRAGAAAFKVFLNFGEPLAPQRRQLFDDLRTRFRHAPDGG